MKFKTRELELSRAFDEVFLRLFLIASRVLQIVISIPIIGFVAALISGFSNAELDVPSKASGALAVASLCTVYSGVTILPIFFEGPMFFTTIAGLDTLFLAAWATLVGVWDHSATSSCRAFIAEYFDSQPERHSFTTNCKLTKAMFAFIIVNVALFGTTTIISFCLRAIELEHSTQWKSLPLFRKTEKTRSEQHCSCCNHNQENPSPRSSFSGDRLRPGV
ncbi:uncharacterized protein A1O9_04161 [Exophiala aquamarina CBS 119918]|uniref:MARVEL domain-containing protein n=1 Tax=Exophiala aquamarina CBS 119918 TaxID=1182545 RepID=A0A072PHW5_9EURO|nr:uncharacterized protein A1O9_04161 [Exophiala aquamarina CBS 119918]KEF59317.1 hypothetical protein A1O9_04161 [Exophiala aquamarina CBS 119918]